MCNTQDEETSLSQSSSAIVALPDSHLSRAFFGKVLLSERFEVALESQRKSFRELICNNLLLEGTQLFRTLPGAKLMTLYGSGQEEAAAAL